MNVGVVYVLEGGDGVRVYVIVILCVREYREILHNEF